MKRKETIAMVGCGSLASFLGPALKGAGYSITEVIARSRPQSLRRARALAAQLGARAVSADSAALDAQLLWFCVPDREIRGAAVAIARRISVLGADYAASSATCRMRFAFHSSGALLSRELEPLRKAGMAVASVHPLMTFVAGPRPSLAGVPFALEGDVAATELARRITRDLSGESFLLSARHKAAYHAWATMTSPLLVAYLVTMEDAARAGGLAREDARRMSLPIILQTLANYASLGPDHSFSGPFIRGDAETVAKHLALLKKNPQTRDVYMALARAAIERLPVKNRQGLQKLLKGTS